MNTALFEPVFAMMGVTILVWFYMYFRRLSAMMALKQDPQKYQRKDGLAKLPDEVNFASDNFINLLEVPVLFYVLTGVVAYLNLADPFIIAAAWGFVGLRALHSFVQCTYNKVMHRFLIYVLSFCCFLAMFVRAASNFIGA